MPKTQDLTSLDDTAPDESCGQCRFYLLAAGDPTGHCRRFPPTVFIPRVKWDDASVNIVASNQLTSRPYVQASWWCGEFKRGQVQ